MTPAGRSRHRRTCSGVWRGRSRKPTGATASPSAPWKRWRARSTASWGPRRGVNMGILRVDHPDIMEFVACKDDTTKITNFNISVAVTDAFMEAVEADAMYDLHHPKTGKVVGQLEAREVWSKIIHGAWKTGEPGV